MNNLSKGHMFALPTCVFGTFLCMLWVTSVLQLWHDKSVGLSTDFSVSDMAHVHFQFKFVDHFPPSDFFLLDVYSMYSKLHFNSHEHRIIKKISLLAHKTLSIFFMT